MLKYFRFWKKTKKLLIFSFILFLIILTVNLQKENLYELLESIEYFFHQSNYFNADTISFRNGENKKMRIFCLILTKADNFKTKTRAVSQTWAKECDEHRFISLLPNEIGTKRLDIAQDDLNILKPEGLLDDQYNLLTNKVYLALIDVSKNYKSYDYYLKTDDDTFIFIDHLRLYLNKQLNSKRMFYYGHKFYSLSSYNSGGAGYVLPKRVLDVLTNSLINNSNFCPNTGIEDSDVGKCLRQLNIFPMHALDQTNRKLFHPFDVGFHFKDCIFSFQVS